MRGVIELSAQSLSIGTDSFLYIAPRLRTWPRDKSSAARSKRCSRCVGSRWSGVSCSCKLIRCARREFEMGAIRLCWCGLSCTLHLCRWRNSYAESYFIEGDDGRQAAMSGSGGDASVRVKCKACDRRPTCAILQEFRRWSQQQSRVRNQQRCRVRNLHLVPPCSHSRVSTKEGK